MDFFETRMGHKFYNHDVPKLIQTLERIADAIELANELRQEEMKINSPGK